MIRKIKSTNII